MEYGCLPGCCPSRAEQRSGTYLCPRQDVFCLSQRVTGPLQGLPDQPHSLTCNVVLCSIELKKTTSPSALHCCRTWL